MLEVEGAAGRVGAEVVGHVKMGDICKGLGLGVGATIEVKTPRCGGTVL